MEEDSHYFLQHSRIQNMEILYYLSLQLDLTLLVYGFFQCYFFSALVSSFLGKNDGSCIYIAQPPGPSGPPTPIPPCNHAFTSSMVAVTYNPNTEKFSYTFTIDAPTGGVVDANGNQNYRYQALYMIDGFGSQTVKELVNATNTLNNTPGMVDGTYVGSLTIQDEQVITNDYVGYLPMPAGNRLFYITVRVYDENHPTNDPSYIQANPSASSCFVIQAMQFPVNVTLPATPIIPGTFYNMLLANSNTSATVAVYFDAPTGGTAPYSYFNAQWRETDVNGNVVSGMTGTYSPVQQAGGANWSPQPGFANAGVFLWTWPQGQTTAYITVEYDILDSSTPQQTVTGSQTITLTKPI